MSRTLPEPNHGTAVVGAEMLRRVCAQFATGIAIATVTGSNGQPHGLTINSFTSVSCNPPLVLICIDYRCSLLTHFRASCWFGLNVLAADQQHLSRRFADFTGDRFESVDWLPGPQTGVPMLPGSLAHMECCVSQVVEAGDHAVLFAEVIAAQCRPGEPLLYFGSSYRVLVPPG
ncbi:MAG: flavin reductase family protein [Bryobacteraceae bacterium]|nr:flavin reductase family protein [Bryobacteraceae bacterium]